MTGAAGARARAVECVRDLGAPVAPPPPSCNTGVELTAGVHDMRGTSRLSLPEVLDYLTSLTGQDVVVTDGGLSGYTKSYWVGQVRVMVNPERLDMGVNVLISGNASDELGLGNLASIYYGLGLKASRFDVRLDHCPFTPGMLQAAWLADDVRTRCKPARDAREGWEEVRNCDWHESPKGDTFSMGSRKSTQFARCYDMRGFTRFELELKGKRADAAAQLVLSLASEADKDKVGEVVKGLVLEFVSFVDGSTSANRSRCTPLPWWGEFMQGIERVKVSLVGAAVRTIEDVREYFDHHFAPTVAMLVKRFGIGEMKRLAHVGEMRWKSRHKRIMAGYSTA